MEPRKNWKGLLRVTGEIATLAFFAFSLAADLTIFQIPVRYLGFISFFFFVIIIIRHIYDYKRQIDQLKNERPRILSRKPGVHQHSTTIFVRNPIQGNTNYLFTGSSSDPPYSLSSELGVKEILPPINIYMVYAEFENKPIGRNTESTAKGVIALITFYDQNHNQSFSFRNVRWEHTQAPSTRNYTQQSREFYKVDLESSGLPRRLYFAVKQVGKDDLFVFNEDSYQSHVWQLDTLKLSSGIYYVRIELSGDNVDDLEYWFMLTPGDPGTEPEVETIDKPKENYLLTRNIFLELLKKVSRPKPKTKPSEKEKTKTSE